MSAFWNIVIYEDDAKYRKILGNLVGSGSKLNLVGSFGECTFILDHIRVLKPDIILIDIEMPNMSGIEGINLVKSYHEQIKTIILTHFDDDDKIFNGIIQGGADGYLLKNTPPDKIYESIEDVMAGGSVMSPFIAKKAIELFNSNRQISFGSWLGKKDQFNLTTTESKVLGILAKGYSYKMIASELNISINTVKNHLKKVYQKMQVNSAPEAVSLAIRQNLV